MEAARPPASVVTVPSVKLAVREGALMSGQLRIVDQNESVKLMVEPGLFSVTFTVPGEASGAPLVIWPMPAVEVMSQTMRPLPVKVSAPEKLKTPDGGIARLPLPTLTALESVGVPVSVPASMTVPPV